MIVALVPLMAGCFDEPRATELRDAPSTIEVAQTWQVSIDALLPSDVLARADGGFDVLDSYRGRILRYSARRELVAEIGSVAAWGRPVRMAEATPEGTWLVDPAGVLLRVDDAGAVVEEISMPSPEGPAPGIAPVTVAEDGDRLVVADRHGRLAWIRRSDGGLDRIVDVDVDGVGLGMVADLVHMPGGWLFAVDALEAKVQALDGEGTPRTWFGRFGMWVGYLRMPKAAAPAPGGGVLVADSALGAVQAFGIDGRFVGILARDGEYLRFEHPVAIEVAADREDFLVLDAGTATVWGARVTREAVATAGRGATQRALRVALVEQDEDPAGPGGRTCRQCHDGIVNDGREVWDPELGHHPCDIVPERELPAFFPLDEEGKIRCTTCHSPHGVSTLDEVNSASAAGERAELVRHAPGDDLLTRMTREDSALCAACHEDAAHEGLLERMGVAGNAHPVGSALVEALQKRGGDTDPFAGCLGCHAVHGATEEGLGRDTTDGRSCATCHADHATAGVTHPLGAPDRASSVRPRLSANVPLGHDGGPTCRSCHDLAGGEGKALLRAPQDGGELCTACHEDRALGAGDHGKLPGAAGNACLACHDPHGLPITSHFLRSVSSITDADPRGCRSCHAPGAKAASAGLDPGRKGHPVDGEEHDGEALTCDTCHEPHSPRPGAEASCERCHEEQGAAEHRGGHGRAECLDCHPAHRDQPVARVARDVNPQAQRCLACHGALAPTTGARDAPRVLEFEHAAPVFLPDGRRWEPLGGLPLYGPDGTELPTGQNGDLTCGSCHLVHGPDEKRPGDNLRRPDWKTACSSCHGENALPLYRYFHQPERRANLEVAPQ